MKDWVMEGDELDWRAEEGEGAEPPPPPTRWERLALLGLKTAYKEFKARPHWYHGFGVATGDTPWAVMAEDWRIIENTVCMAMDDEAERMGNVGEDEWPDVRGITLHAVGAFLGRAYPRQAPRSMAVATWGLVSRFAAARMLYEREGAIRQIFGDLLQHARAEGRLGPAVDQEKGSWLMRH